MNIITKIECFIVGWKPVILKECREASYAMLKKYTAAITILSIIWGVIGWCFAADYIKIESWYGKAITSMFFITIIVCVERYIILSHGNMKAMKIFRICLAVLMAFLGSTIFDQIVFKDSIDVEKRKIMIEEARNVIDERRKDINTQVSTNNAEIASLSLSIDSLSKEIAKNPAIIVPTQSKQWSITKDENGNERRELTGISTSQSTYINPRTAELTQKLERVEQLKNINDTIQNNFGAESKEIMDRYQEKGGFLFELKAVYSLLFKEGNTAMLVFYFVLFAFLMCLELLVITTKGKDNCDYEILLEFQLKQRKKELDALDNQP